MAKILAKIFGYLDFETLQFKVTLVCKNWFKIIRSDCTLSGHLILSPPSSKYLPGAKIINEGDRGDAIMKLKRRESEVTYLKTVPKAMPSDINPLLKHWKALKTLELRHFNINTIKHLDFKTCKNLAKVIVNGQIPQGKYCTRASSVRDLYIVSRALIM